MNEFDQHVKNVLKPRAYLRYGDDFFIIADTEEEVCTIKKEAIEFLKNRLRLKIHPKNDIIVPVKRGLKFLGVEIFPKGRRLKRRNWKRALERSDTRNLSSYSGLVKRHCKEKKRKEFQWTMFQKMENDL